MQFLARTVQSSRSQRHISSENKATHSFPLR
jgi:hypothetical protein